MISLLISLAVLLIGFFVYGRITEKIFAPDDRPTPAVAINDGVDRVPMKTRKVFLIKKLRSPKKIGQQQQQIQQRGCRRTENSAAALRL